jgi:hypothetical protein
MAKELRAASHGVIRITDKQLVEPLEGPRIEVARIDLDDGLADDVLEVARQGELDSFEATPLDDIPAELLAGSLLQFREHQPIGEHARDSDDAGDACRYLE